MGALTYQSVLIVLIGTVVFVLGTVNLKSCMKRGRSGKDLFGKVLHVKLIEKRDEQKRLVQHYYEVTVQYEDNRKVFNRKIRTTEEYAQGDRIRLMRDGSQILAYREMPVSTGMSVMIIFSGMMLAIFPVIYGEEGDVEGSIVLVLFLIFIGNIAFAAYRREHNRKLSEIEGEIVEVLYYTKGKKRKLTKTVESYYPLIRYRVGEKARIFLSSYNSSQKTAYKIGTSVKLYYDEERKIPVERKANRMLFAVALLMWILATTGVFSIINLLLTK